MESVEKLVVYLVCMTLLSISREDRTKWILFIRIRPVFLYVSNLLDVLGKIAV